MLSLDWLAWGAASHLAHRTRIDVALKQATDRIPEMTQGRLAQESSSNDASMCALPSRSVPCAPRLHSMINCWTRRNA